MMRIAEEGAARGSSGPGATALERQRDSPAQRYSIASVKGRRRGTA